MKTKIIKKEIADYGDPIGEAELILIEAKP